jgi:2-amino-4-hydroxy-6-hydroxymethyldihydropteridine diphosphokinase
VEVLIGLGGNLGDVRKAFSGARAHLARVGTLAEISGSYRTKPVGPPQPDYLNAAVVLVCGCGPRQLLDECQRAERAAGRDRRTEHCWGPRTLDLDLLLVRGAVLQSRSLEIPHPRFHERPFALVPAAEVAGQWVHPILGSTVAELAAARARLDPDAAAKLEA